MSIRYALALALTLGCTVLAADEKADDKAASKDSVNPVAGMLTKAQIQEGWIALFDGQTPFGWKIEGEGKVADGVLVLGGKKTTTAETTTRFGGYELSLEGEGLEHAKILLGGEPLPPKPLAGSGDLSARIGAVDQASPVVIRVPAGKTVRIKKVVLKPDGLKPIFNGKDLSGWKELPGHASKFSVTDKGEINIKDGNGSLQSEWTGDDFVLQIEGISNGKQLNSGVFYRALPGEFWQGYEVQVRNQWEGDDRTKPVDYGTGGIYNRQKTRKVIPNDGEWFTITLVAQGPHMATWVNGYQCTDYVDEQADAPSARKGRYLGKGCLSLQGHDPTTDLNYKNIRVADLPKKGEAK